MLSRLFRVTPRTPRHARMSSTSLSVVTTPETAEDKSLMKAYRNLLTNIQTGKQQRLDLRQFKSFSANIPEDLAQVFSEGNSKLIQEINFAGMGLGAKIINAIMQLLGLSKSLSVVNRIDFSGNGLNMREASELVAALPSMEALRDITLDENTFTSTAGIEEGEALGNTGFFEALAKAPKIVSLSLNKVEGVDLVIDELTSYIENKTALQTVRLGGTNLSDENTFKILKSLSNSKSLKHLDLSGCQIGLRSSLELRKVIENNKLEVLDLSNTCKYGEIAELLQSIAKGEGFNVREVRLANNGIDSTNLDALFSFARPPISAKPGRVLVPTTTTILDLSYNDLADSGVSTIYNSLNIMFNGAQNIAIKIGRNKLTYSGIKSLVEGLHALDKNGISTIAIDLGDDIYEEWQANELMSITKKKNITLTLKCSKTKPQQEKTEEATSGLFSMISSFFGSHKKTIEEQSNEKAQQLTRE